MIGQMLIFLYYQLPNHHFYYWLDMIGELLLARMVDWPNDIGPTDVSSLISLKSSKS